MSASVAEYGSLALGALAADPENLFRLIGSGAGAAVVSSLRQHKKSAFVVSRSAYAVHHLAQGDNNVSWLGACGTCEALLTALALHAEHNSVVAHMGARAVGSLAYHDEGNISKLRGAGVAEIVLSALRTHAASANVSEYCCRAVYNLCLNSALVSDLGALGACEAVVHACVLHRQSESVVAQALLAISSLAVKRKNEKVHQGNIRKLVNAGAVESVVELLTAFQTSAAVVRSAGLAVAALARQDTYSVRLGGLGAPKLLLKCLQMHRDSAEAVTTLFAAVNSLSAQVDENRQFFAANGIVALVFAAMYAHEKTDMLVAEGFRILVTVAVDEACRKDMVSDNQLKLVARVIKLHEKHDFASKWGCTFISTIADSDGIRAMLGRHRACEVVVGVLAKHNSERDDDHHAETFSVGASVTELANRAVVSLCLLEENRARLNNADSCEAVVKSLRTHMADAGAVEWAAAAMVSLASNSSCVNLMGSADACKVLTAAMTEHTGSEIIVRLCCELVNALSRDEQNKGRFGASGMCEALAPVLSFHAASASVSLQVCRAVCSLVRDHDANLARLSSTKICEGVAKVLVAHAYNVTTCKWGCSAVAALANGSSANQNALESFGCVESLVGALVKHKGQQNAVEDALRAVRRLASQNPRIAARLSEAGVVGAALEVMSRHYADAGIVECCGWVLGKCASASDLEFASSAACWEKLEGAVKTHAGKESTVRWLCEGMGRFAALSVAPRASACDIVMNMLGRHGGSPSLVSHAAHAIGSLALDPQNRAHLVSIGAIEALASCVISFVDKQAAKVGVFRALALLVDGADSQKRFSDVPKACKSLVKSLYEDVEYEEVALWGCRAIAALARHNKVTSRLLGSAANFTDEIVKQHKGSVDTLRAVLQVVSVLAHCNTSNRSLFGESGSCDEVCEALPLLSYEDEGTAQLACRAVADLAANHPNNQRKLGESGACKFLVGVMSSHCVGEDVDELSGATTARLACWAIANVVQQGKGKDRQSSLKTITSGLTLSDSSSRRTRTNSMVLLDEKVVPLAIALLKKYGDKAKTDPETVLWIVRMVNNLAKDRALREQLQAAGAMAMLDELAFAENGRKAAEWVTIAKETLGEDARPGLAAK